jgi:uncharacterized protein YecT (DUF1311 family)
MNILRRVTFAALLVSLLAGFVQRSYAQSEAATGAEQLFKKADAELNQVCDDVTKKLTDGRQKTDFIKAQKAWVSFRDADAEFRAGVTGGGSAYTTDYLANLTELTEERTKQLSEFLKHLPSP